MSREKSQLWALAVVPLAITPFIFLPIVASTKAGQFDNQPRPLSRESIAPCNDARSVCFQLLRVCPFFGGRPSAFRARRQSVSVVANVFLSVKFEHDSSSWIAPARSNWRRQADEDYLRAYSDSGFRICTNSDSGEKSYSHALHAGRNFVLDDWQLEGVRPKKHFCKPIWAADELHYVEVGKIDGAGFARLADQSDFDRLSLLLLKPKSQRGGDVHDGLGFRPHPGDYVYSGLFDVLAILLSDGRG